MQTCRAELRSGVAATAIARLPSPWRHARKRAVSTRSQRAAMNGMAHGHISPRGLERKKPKHHGEPRRVEVLDVDVAHEGHASSIARPRVRACLHELHKDTQHCPTQPAPLHTARSGLLT